MLPKLEKAKQVRASMVLEEQNIASGTIVAGDSVRYLILLLKFDNLYVPLCKWACLFVYEILQSYIYSSSNLYSQWEVKKWMKTLETLSHPGLKMLVFKLPADYPVGGFWEAYLGVQNRPEKVEYILYWLS